MYRPKKSIIAFIGLALIGVIACPERLARNADLLHHSREWHLPIRYHCGPRPTTTHGPTRGPRRKGRYPIVRNQQDRSLFSQQLRGNSRGGSGPLRRFLPARGSTESASQLAAFSFVKRPRRLSGICYCG
jgi:hypothetical protein